MGIRHETVLVPYDVSQFRSITTGVQLKTIIYNVINMYLRCPSRCQPICMAYPLHPKQSQVLHKCVRLEENMKNIPWRKYGERAMYNKYYIVEVKSNYIHRYHFIFVLIAKTFINA